MSASREGETQPPGGLAPLQTLYDAASGPTLPLSGELETLYGGS